MAYTSVKISANSSDYQSQMKSAAAQMKPDESGRVCGSVSYGEEVTVETTKVTSKKGKEYYRLAGYGYILASQVRDAESQTEAEAKVDAAVKKAESAARKAEQAAKACDGIAAGMNVVIDSVTGKACEIGMTDGNIVVREA